MRRESGEHFCLLTRRHLGKVKCAPELDEAKPWVAKLVEAGMFLDGRLLEAALESVGE